jgi:hypothetical protein
MAWDIPEFPAVLERVRHRTGKEIAHLTYTRIGLEHKDWPFLEMAQAIRTALTLFAQSADESRLGSALPKFKTTSAI